MPLTPSPAVYSTLTAMITPALFMTSTGSLIISTSNRVARVVDRIRVLDEAYDRLSRGLGDDDFPDVRAAHVQDQILRLIWRSDRVRYALAMLYLAFGCFAGASLTIGVDVMTGNHVGGLPTALAVLGVALMLGASVNQVREVLEALRSNRRDVEFYRDLHARRRAAHPHAR